MRWVVRGLWRLWKCRNSLVFENKTVDPIDAVRMLQQQWQELEDIPKIDGTRTVEVPRGTGRIFRAAGGVGNIACESSLMAEAEALRAALISAVERGLDVIQVETDSKVLEDMLQGKNQLYAVIEGLLYDIKCLQM
ncbi:ribonuclease H protein [Pyrus ussuriensis x Pyrus communis]|uniref:Ribonuclease H protein n=1 Tax=Pyrus ussuriensis x Pyrus communis TaxID=2448454 RepID=A0A5N5HDZ8_9ROSA|nr:ribonuclease H protein [Pyrus ussuriensis x Pyrus communis]